MYSEQQYLGAAERMEETAARLLAEALLMRHTASIQRGEIHLDYDIKEFAEEVMVGNWDVHGMIMDQIDNILTE